MANISKIKLPNGSTYDINAATVNGHVVNKDVPSDAKFTDTTYYPASTSSNGLMSSNDKKNVVYFVPGTQTETTGSWTGVLSGVFELYDGLTINYWLPRPGTGNATLNLTLAGGTTTGAVNCYYKGSSRLTTHYAAGDMIMLTYRNDVSINGSTTKYTGWWAKANYTDGNNIDRKRHTGNIKAGTNVIAGGNIIVGINGLYSHLKLGNAFDITYPILYASSAIGANGTGDNNYTDIAFTVTTTQSISLTAYKPVYIKGVLNGTNFKPISTTPLTQTIPTTVDGYYYMYLGRAYSSTSIHLEESHPIYVYKNGLFQLNNGQIYYGSTQPTNVATGTVWIE